MKILIWDLEIPLVNKGGPSGYLFNIKEYLDNEYKGRKEIYFLSELLFDKNKINSNNSLSKPQSRKDDLYLKLKPFLNKLKLVKILKTYKVFSIWYKILSKSVIKNLDLNEFDIIHFHSSVCLLRASNILKGYNGIKILTTHSPEPLHNEYTSFIKDKNIIKKYFINPVLENREYKAWNLADKIMLPVKEAAEVYFSSIKLKSHFKNKNDKFIYCPSSIKSELEKKNINIKERFNIPENAFIISYVGRHNEIKGYDFLKQIGEIILKKYNNVYFVIAGKEDPLKGLINDRWIELGWIDYGNDLIEQSDLFILPNRQTYFDLVTLEVIRLGTPILMTDTGGNKYLKNFPSDETQGLFFFEYGKIMEFEQVFEKVYLYLSNTDNDNMREGNRRLFKNNFTVERYVNNYLKLMYSITDIKN